MSEILDDAVDLVAAADLLDPEAWLQQAQLLERQGQAHAALEACRRAILLWPDITSAYRLQLRLAHAQDDPDLVLQALQSLHALRPTDPEVNSALGAALCARGDTAAAVPFLRVAVPILGHANDTLWNYTMALASTGSYAELLAAEPLLDRLAAGSAGSYPPFTHLAVAKLSRAYDRDAVVTSALEREASAAWLDPDAMLARLGQAIADQQPFSLVRTDYAMARFSCYLSLHAHRLLRPQELSAMVNSVWEGWFGAPVESLGVLFLSSIERLVSDALRHADVIGIPEAGHLSREAYHFGFLAEMLHTLPAAADASFTSFDIASMMHERLPYLRPLLSGLPFLGLVSPYPAMARKLGLFCGVAETRAITVPSEASRTERTDSPASSAFLPSGHLTLLDELSVPCPGAVFLVSAPGPLAVAYCGRIKSLGGIAIEIGPLADRWAERA